MPVSFEGGRFWITASVWLLVYTQVVTLALGVLAIDSLWAQIDPGASSGSIIWQVRATDIAVIILAALR